MHHTITRWWARPVLAPRDMAVIAVISVVLALLAGSLTIWQQVTLAAFWGTAYTAIAVASRIHHGRTTRVLADTATARWCIPFLEQGWTTVACQAGCTARPGHIHMAPATGGGILTAWYRP